jgi:1-acyl-sn-glycerol-3-phosphate acyltransferase
MLYWIIYISNLKFRRKTSNVPKDGAYITISNHPLGGIDGVLLLKLMLEKAFKIIANFLYIELNLSRNTSCLSTL